MMSLPVRIKHIWKTPTGKMVYSLARSHHMQSQRTLSQLNKYKMSVKENQMPVVCTVLSQNSSVSDNVHCFQQKRYVRNELTKALVLVKDLRHLSSAPGPALTLGLSGLIPFVAAPGYMMMSGGFLEALAFSQAAYGACVLSFIGAVRWGMALSEQEVVRPNWFNLGYSIAPSLVAWIALMLPTSLSLVTLMAGLAGTAYMDLTMFGYPPWFKALRFLLSLVAVLSLWTTLLCRFTLADGEKKEKVKKQVSKPVKEIPAVEPVVSVSTGSSSTEAPVLATTVNSAEEVKEIKD